MTKSHLTTAELEADCKKHWGVIARTQNDILDPNMTPLLDFWNFQIASDDMHGFIQKFAHDVEWSIGNFDDRRSKALRSALLLVAHKNIFPWRPSRDIDVILNGGAAPASAYLLAMIEFFLRARSRYLNEEGELTRIIPNQLQARVKLQQNKIGFRVNQIKKSFHLFIYRNTEKSASHLRNLQRKIKIDERLKLIRNPTMHGSLADPASEAPFYALVVALFYYTERYLCSH